MKNAVHMFIKDQCHEMGIYWGNVQKNGLKVCWKRYQKLISVNHSRIQKSNLIVHVHMSDIYNLDYCTEDCSQMSFAVVWKLWIVQNVLYAITHPKQIEHAFIECQKTQTLWNKFELWYIIVLREKFKISDSEKLLCTAYVLPWTKVGSALEGLRIFYYYFMRLFLL